MRLAISPVLVVCALSALVAVAGCGTSGQAAAAGAGGSERFARLTIAELEAKLATGAVHVFDNNDRESYAAGHIPGAKWVSYDSVQASDLPADHAAQLVFYCANEHCSACHTAADAAIALGYTNVAILPAGIQGWRAAGKPTVAGTRPA